MIDAGSAFGNDIRNAYGSEWITIMESESSDEYLPIILHSLRSFHKTLQRMLFASLLKRGSDDALLSFPSSQ